MYTHKTQTDLPGFFRCFFNLGNRIDIFVDDIVKEPDCCPDGLVQVVFIKDPVVYKVLQDLCCPEHSSHRETTVVHRTDWSYLITPRFREGVVTIYLLIKKYAWLPVLPYPVHDS